MTYPDALKFLYSFATYEIIPATADAPKNLKLERMPRLLDALGNPHQKFQSVHIAGTKGKGSTAAMTESILRAAGIRTGLYTSPHLHTFRERIRVAGEMIARDAVAAGVAKLEPIVAQFPGITTFEIITALAFDYFAAQNVEIAILEVGLGGRLDATNIVTPRVSIITSISYDHMAILGNTLAQIAREKAGIIKAGVPVVAAPQTDEARAVIEEVARAHHSPLVLVTQDFSFVIEQSAHHVTPRATSLNGQSFIWECADDPVELDVKLLGRHQLANATTVLATIAALREQGLAISEDAVRVGLANVIWNGRFEILHRAPFVIIDGAHNGDSIHQLVATLRAFFPRERLWFIFGASNDKDIAAMFAELLPSAASLILTRSHSPRSADVSQMTERARAFPVEISIARDPTHALELALTHAKPGEVICATGSLYIVGEVREAWFARQGAPVETD
jgi:dihydrofolate synthase/folylpolyglutamate synthase